MLSNFYVDSEKMIYKTITTNLISFYEKGVIKELVFYCSIRNPEAFSCREKIDFLRNFKALKAENLLEAKREVCNDNSSI